MSKKVCLLFLIVFSFFLWGCTNNSNFVYDSYIDKLSTINESSTNLPFKVNITVEKLTDDDLIYQVIIDNPDELLYNVKAMIVHDVKVNDIFPSIGIIDEPINLANTSKEGFSKGIILTGYLPYQEEYNIKFKVLIEYTLNNQTFTKYYVTNMTHSTNN
jgi:hypothetical protein